ncbi:N-6 DNA methylase, partial [Streptococcus pyogenes]
KNQNTMTDSHIKKILDAYKSRDNSDKFSYLASFDEIIENDYNLNIPRYVDTFEEVPVKPLPELAKQLSDIDQEIAKTNAKLDQLMKQLVGTTKEAQDELDTFRN